MSEIPQVKSPDSTLTLFKEGYRFIINRCNKLQSNIFETRLLFKKTICMKGEEEAKIFYDNEHFKRGGVPPKLVLHTLFGEGGVQGLDGEDHYNRKQMFMSLMGPEAIEDISLLATEQWLIYSKKWTHVEQVVLFTEVQEILCRVVCEWAGVPLDEEEVAERTQDMAAMIDGVGSIGKRHWNGRASRKKTESWIRNMISKIRENEMEAPKWSALHIISNYRDLQNNLLDEQIAAVEMLNILRPVIAVSRYIVFAALALHQFPEYRQKLREDEELLECFVDEVRRFFPSFPFVAAEVKKEFSWKGYLFPKGRKVLLDLYGTNHDPGKWENPDQFKPERFLNRENSAFDFIPQGGGSFQNNHRCAGEWITVSLLKVAVDFLTRSMEYDVPDQDLDIDLSRIPAIPKSRFIIRNVRLRKVAFSTF